MADSPRDRAWKTNQARPQRRRRFTPAVVGGFEPKMPPKEKFMARFTPQPDSADRAAAARDRNVQRGARPSGGPGAREIDTTTRTYAQAQQAGGTEAVRRLQRNLRASGFAVAVDGVWGPQTEAAHKKHLATLKQAVTGNIQARQQAVGEAMLTPGRAGSRKLAKQLGPAGFAVDVARGGLHQRVRREFERRDAIKQFAGRLSAEERVRQQGIDTNDFSNRVQRWIGGGLRAVDSRMRFLGGPRGRERLSQLGARQIAWSARVTKSEGGKSLLDYIGLGEEVGRVGANIHDWLASNEQVQQSGLGDIGGPLSAAYGFGSRLVEGIAVGALSTPGAALYAVSDPKGLAREMAAAYAWQYGPLFEGDLAEFASRFNESPAGPVLDAWAVLTLGAGAGARAGLIPKRGPIREMHVPGHPPVQYRAARTQLMRNVQAAFDNLSMKHPQAPFIGSLARAARRIHHLRQVRGDESHVPSAAYKEALNKFESETRLSPAKRQLGAVMFDRRLRYGDGWQEGIAAEIVMRRNRMQEPDITRPEWRMQSTIVRQLERIQREPVMPDYVERLVDEGIDLANLTEAMKIRLGMFGEETAARRKQLSWEIVADYRNIDSAVREQLDWLLRQHYRDEMADVMMNAIDGVVWAKAGGPSGDVNAAYGAFLQEIHGDPFALPSPIVFPPGVDDAGASQSILYSRDRAPDFPMPDELDWTALEQALTSFELPPAMKANATYVLNGVYDLAKRGRLYRDWYERAAAMAKAVERISGQTGTPVSAWKVAQLMAIYSQQATVQQNAMFALRAIRAWQDGQDIPLGAGGVTQKAKAEAILKDESYKSKQPDKSGVSLGVTNGEWDGIKTSSYAANILQHVDPERYRQVFGENHYVTVDRHVADMFDPSLGQNPGRYYEGIAQAILELSRQAGMTPSEFQAAAWVTWKAKKLLRNRTYTEQRAWREAMDAYEIGVNQFADVPDEVAIEALAELEHRVDADPDRQQLSLLDDVQAHPRSPDAASRPLFEPRTLDQRYEEILRKVAVHFGSKAKKGPTPRQKALAEEYLLDWSGDNPDHPMAQKFMALYERRIMQRNAESDAKAAPFLYQREGRQRATEAQRNIDAVRGQDLDGLPTEVNIPNVGKVEWHANREIQQLAFDYMQKAGLDYLPPTRYVPVNPEKAKAIAAAYDRMKHAPQDPMVQETYRAFIEETMAQYQALIDAGYRPEFYPEGGDPYPNSPRESALDIIENKHMYVFPTEAGFGSGPDDFPNHPLMGVAEGVDWGNGKPVYYNDIFRFVHDVFGHVKEGVGFRADGEDNAWRSHAAMYSHKARNAMTAETRGQNSWVNYGPHGEKNRTASQMDTVYADQKAGLLPGWIQDDLDPPQPGGALRPTPGTIGEWEAMRELRGELDQELGPSARDPLEEIPTLRDDDLEGASFISDRYGPPPEAQESVIDPLQGLGRDVSASQAREPRVTNLEEIVTLPPDAYAMTAREAFEVEPDPRMVYHGTDQESAHAALQERKLKPGGPLGGVGDRAWVAENPKLAAQYAQSRAASVGGEGVVIAIPRSAVPAYAQRFPKEPGRYGGDTFASPDGYLFQRGRKTKITAEEVDSDVIRGAASFDPANRMRIFLGPEADASTPFHELAHGMRRHLPDIVGRDLWSAVEREVAEAVGKPIEAGKWTEAHEEHFARAAVRWFREGDAPTPNLLKAYTTIKQALRELYPNAASAGPAPGPAIREALSRGGRPFEGDPRTGAAFVPDWTRQSLGKGGGRGFPRIKQGEGRVKQTRGILFRQGRFVADPEVTLRDFERTQQYAYKLIDIEALRKFARPWDWEAEPMQEGWVPIIFRGQNPVPRVFQEEFDWMDRTPKEYAAEVRQAESEALAEIFPAPEQIRKMADQEGADNIEVFQIPKQIRDAYMDRVVRIPGQARNLSPALAALDMVNAITKGAVVYGKLSYIPVNYAGNLIFLTIDAGPLFAVTSLKRTMKHLTDLDVEDLAWIDSQVGQGAAAALATERGKVADFLRDLAAWQSNHADRGPRRAAWVAAARRHGYRTKADIKRLREDPSLEKIKNQIGYEAEDAMVRFRGLTPFERDVLSRVIFLYGWTRGATRWLWNFATEKPVLADITYHAGNEAAEWIEEKLGVVPDYMRTLVPWGSKMKKRGVMVQQVRDLRSINPISTGAEVLEAGANLLRGDPQAAGAQVSDMLSPALKIPFEVATGYNTFFGRPYDNRWEAVYGQVGRWPLVRLGQQMVDPTVDITDAYGESTSTDTNYLPPDDPNEARLQELSYFLGGGILRGRDLNLKAAQKRGREQNPEARVPWDKELLEDAKRAGIKVPPMVRRFAEAKEKLDTDPRTDRGTPYTEKLQAAVDIMEEYYPQAAQLVRQSAKRIERDEEQSRLLYLRIREQLFSEVNELRARLDAEEGDDG